MDFKEIKNIGAYVVDRIRNRGDLASQFKKTVYVHARRGIPGETIRTVMKSGLTETVNTVNADPDTNAPDWVVKNPGGEMYVVTDKVFCEKYTAVPGEEGLFEPVGKPVIAVRADENIRFDAPWGEEIRLISGGWIIIASAQDIYAVQQEEFEQTYQPCDCDARVITAQVLALLEK